MKKVTSLAESTERLLLYTRRPNSKRKTEKFAINVISGGYCFFFQKEFWNRRTGGGAHDLGPFSFSLEPYVDLLFFHLNFNRLF